MEWLNQNGIGASEELLEPSDRRPAQNGTDPTCKNGRQREGTALRAAGASAYAVETRIGRSAWDISPLPPCTSLHIPPPPPPLSTVGASHP